MVFMLTAYLTAGVQDGERLGAPVALLQHIPDGWIASRTVESAANMCTSAAADMGVASIVFDMSKIRPMTLGAAAGIPAQAVEGFLGDGPKTTWDFAQIKSLLAPAAQPGIAAAHYLFVKGQVVSEGTAKRVLADGYYAVDAGLDSPGAAPVQSWGPRARVTVHVAVSTALPMAKMLQSFVGAMDAYATGATLDARAMLGEVECGIERYEHGASLALRREIVLTGFKLASVYVTSLGLVTKPWTIPGLAYTLGWTWAAEYAGAAASYTVGAVTLPLRMPAFMIRALMLDP
jgi:hypothetical protein